MPRAGFRGVLLPVLMAGVLCVSGKVDAMEIESGSLPNGMKLVVVPDHRAPVVVHSVWYTVGSVDEEAGRTGLSHMLEHMMFKGTKRFPPQEMDKIVQRNGGVQNAFTSRDMTAYHQTITVDKMPLMMDMEADRMTGLNINNDLLAPEKNVVLEERRLRTESQPQSRFFEDLMKVHYPQHPYGNPVIGWRKDIEDYKLADVTAWYRKHYAPNNAMLLVVGDTTLEQIKPLAAKYYAAVPPMKDVPQRVAHVEPLRDKPLRLERIEKDVQVPVFYRLYRTPSMFQGVAGSRVDPKDVVALRVMAEVLGGSDAARLYQSLVVDQHLADGASSDYDFVSAAETTVDIQVTPKPGVTMDRIDAAVVAELEKLKTQPVKDAEVARAKVNILADVIYGQDDNDTLMWHVGSWVLAGGKLEEFNAWQDLLKQVTPADVMRVAKVYLVPAGETTGLLVQNKAQLGGKGGTARKPAAKAKKKP